MSVDSFVLFNTHQHDELNFLLTPLFFLHFSMLSNFHTIYFATLFTTWSIGWSYFSFVVVILLTQKVI